jgi:D-glycero-D-manno-heptose 1,7-bisphosphate phosphatase
MPRPLVLLDRDGVINEDLVPNGVTDWDMFRFLPRALKAIGRLREAGFRIAICTNQSAIGKGLMDEATLSDIHARMQHALAAYGGEVDAIYVAPDHPNAPTHRRKPGPGMLEEALLDFGAHARITPFIGDALRDIEAAAAAGCPAICVRTGKGADTIQAGFASTVPPVACVEDLYEAAEYVIAHYASRTLE